MARVPGDSRHLMYARDFDPDSTLARLVALIGEGAVQSQVEAAQRLGVSKQRIHQLVKDYGLSLKRPLLTEAMVCGVCGRGFRRALNSRQSRDVCYRCLHSPIFVTCAQCGATRRIRRPERRKSDLCALCWRRGLGQYWKHEHALRGPPVMRVTLVCSACGKERRASPAQAGMRKTSLCYGCWIRSMKTDLSR